MAQRRRETTPQKMQSAPGVDPDRLVRVNDEVAVTNSAAGATVTRPPAGGPVRRTPPVLRPPRDFAPLIGRERQQQQARDLLPDGPVEFWGPDGVGKSSLLRHIGNRPGSAGYDELVHVHWATAADLGQRLADAFCTWADQNVRDKWPADALLTLVGQVHALIEIDNVAREPVGIEQLLDWFGGCDFLLASESGHPGVASTISLPGLDAKLAMDVVETYAGAALTPAERPLAERVCTAVACRPGHLKAIGLQLGREQDKAAWLQELLDARDVAASASARLTADLTDDARRVFDTLCLLPEARMKPDLIGCVAGVTSVDSALAELEARGLIGRNSPEFSVCGGAAERVSHELHDELRTNLLTGLGDWARSQDSAGATAADQSVADLVPRVAALIDQNPGEVPWDNVLAWVQAIDDQLLLAGYWDAWELALSIGLVGAYTIGDRGATAWAWHQLGTRALALGDVESAGQLLSDARELREDLGDYDGAALSAQNMDFLGEDPVLLGTGPPLLGPSGRFGVELPRLAEAIEVASANARSGHAAGAGLVRAAVERGDALFTSGDREGAAAEYARADELGDGRAAWKLGVLLHYAGDRDGAEAAYRRALQRGEIGASGNLGLLLYERGDTVEAADTFRAGIAAGDAHSAYMVARTLEDMGNARSARDAYLYASRAGHQASKNALERLLAAQAEAAEPEEQASARAVGAKTDAAEEPEKLKAQPARATTTS